MSAAASEGLPFSMARDALAALTALLVARKLVVVLNLFTSTGLLKQVYCRKLVHVFAGPMFLLCWPLFSTSPQARLWASLIPFLHMLRRRREEHLLAGPIYYAAVLLAASLFSWRESPVGVVAVALMSGDGLADLVRLRFGTPKLSYNVTKSWAESATCFFGGWAAASGLLNYLQIFGGIRGIRASTSDIVSSAGLISVAAAVVDFLPVRRWLNYNLAVPLMSAFGAWALLEQ